MYVIFFLKKLKGKNWLDFLWSNLKTNKKKIIFLFICIDREAKCWLDPSLCMCGVLLVIFYPLGKKCHFSTHFNCNIVQVSIHWMLEPSYENHYSSNKFLLWKQCVEMIFVVSCMFLLLIFDIMYIFNHVIYSFIIFNKSFSLDDQPNPKNFSYLSKNKGFSVNDSWTIHYFIPVTVSVFNFNRLCAWLQIM